MNTSRKLSKKSPEVVHITVLVNIVKYAIDENVMACSVHS